jgi:hypothetical protein
MIDGGKAKRSDDRSFPADRGGEAGWRTAEDGEQKTES